MLRRFLNNRSPGGEVTILRRYSDYGVLVDGVAVGLEVSESGEIESEGTFTSVTVTGLTASRVVETDASKTLVSSGLDMTHEEAFLMNYMAQ